MRDNTFVRNNILLFILFLIPVVLLFMGCSFMEHNHIGNQSANQTQGNVINNTASQTANRSGSIVANQTYVNNTDSMNDTNVQYSTGELSYTYAPLSNITVCFIDVGYGDSVLIKKGDFDMLVDAGNEASGPHVVSLLDQLGVDDIEIMALSSMTDDRMGGMKSVLQSYNAEQFWDNGVDYLEDNEDYSYILDVLNNRHTKIIHPTRGYHLYEDGISIDVLNPPSNRFNSINNPEADSLTLLIKDRNFTLFLSDLSTTTQNNLISDHPNITARVMKVSQHGGGSVGVEERVGSFLFISKLRPDIAVVSVGPNDRGLPNPTILESYRLHNVDVYRTDTQGTICITSDGYHLNATTSR